MPKQLSGQLTDMSGRAANARQVCDYCGGRFGMVTHRWWGNKFCKAVCKDAYLREVKLGLSSFRRWFGLTRSPPRIRTIGGSALCAR